MSESDIKVNIQPSEIQPQSEQPKEARAPVPGMNKIKSSHLQIALMALLLISITTAGYLGYKYYVFNNTLTVTPPQPEQPVKTIPTITPILTPVFSISVNPATGQNLYSNTTYGFSFEYPKDFVIENQNPPSIGVMGNNIVGLIRRSMYFLPNYLQNISRYNEYRNRFTNIKKLNVGESYTYEPVDTFFETTTRIADMKIGGITSYVFDVPKVWEGEGPYREIYLPKGDDYIQIFYTNSNDKEDPIDYVKGFNQILSTFKFTY